MTDHEARRGFEYASEDELAKVYATTAAWLEHNGEYFVEPTDEVRGAIDGVPIMDSAPRMQFEIEGTVLKENLPRVVETLAVGGL